MVLEAGKCRSRYREICAGEGLLPGLGVAAFSLYFHRKESNHCVSSEQGRSSPPELPTLTTSPRPHLQALYMGCGDFNIRVWGEHKLSAHSRIKHKGHLYSHRSV